MPGVPERGEDAGPFGGRGPLWVLSGAMHKTLIVTNDFPPRPGGIQAFLHNMALRLDPEQIVVYASTWKRGREGAEATAAFDAEQPFQVVRDPTTMLLPTPRVTRRAVSLLREHGCTSVWFGAAGPLGLMAPALRKAGATRLVATTHGHEAGWAQLPASRQLLRRIGESTDTITYLGEYTRSRIAAALTPAAAGRMVQLPPGVDEKTFHPGSGGDVVRARLADGPARGGLRLPACAAQGAGHADPCHAGDPGAGAGGGAAGGRRRALRERPAQAGRRDRCRGLRPLHGGGAVGGAARALRRR